MSDRCSPTPDAARPKADPSSCSVSWDRQGHVDWLVGTGATQAERVLGYGAALVLSVMIVGADLVAQTPIASTWWQLAILIFFAFDIAGGAVANMLNSCKRHYHGAASQSEGRLARALRNARVFTLLHVHPILIALVFSAPVEEAVLWYLALQSAVWMTLATPLYLRRAAATALTLMAVLVNQVWLPFGSGLEWVVPALFIKLVMGHAVREEPYASRSQRTRNLRDDGA